MGRGSLIIPGHYPVIDVPNARVPERYLGVRRAAIARGRDPSHEPTSSPRITGHRSQAPLEKNWHHERTSPRVRAPVHIARGIGHGPVDSAGPPPWHSLDARPPRAGREHD